MNEFISYLVVCLILAFICVGVYFIFKGFRTMIEKIVLKIKETKGVRKDGK